MHCAYCGQYIKILELHWGAFCSAKCQAEQFKELEQAD